MAVIDTSTRSFRAAPLIKLETSGTWSRGDGACAFLWLAVALAARAYLAARIEGLLDHDQGIVGLMALDISEARRWPIFFDGQRYMGALEAYTAAIFVKLFGHSPVVIAMAPTLYFGLFVAGQYVLWRQWTSRAAGHLAALVTAVGSPMLAIWGVTPRGGYSEILAWSVPVLLTYRAVTQPGGKPMTRARQALWGFLLAFGLFLNPLSLIVYTTLAIDWVFGRHGADLKRERHLGGGWVDSPFAPVIWAAIVCLVPVALAAFCHVVLVRPSMKMKFVYLFDQLPHSIAAPLAVLGVGLIVGWIAWWTGAARRLFGLLSTHLGFGLGAIVSLLPFLVYNLRVLRGLAPREPSLPIWIRAPWAIGPNVRDGLYALRPLIGCDPHAASIRSSASS
jgi:hypothetical protein